MEDVVATVGEKFIRTYIIREQIIIKEKVARRNVKEVKDVRDEKKRVINRIIAEKRQVILH